MIRRTCLGVLFAALAWAQADSPVRYIVQLSAAPAIKMKDRVAGRAAVAREHDSFERSFHASVRSGNVVARLDTAINAMVVEAPPGSEAQLAMLPGVQRVERDRVLKLDLDHALVLHKIKDAWAASGHQGEGIKVGMLDTGIDSTHPGFQAPDMYVPPGYPMASNSANLTFCNNKIIVARSYDTSPSYQTVQDYYGHGTSTAMAAAGVQVTTPTGATISGFAPRAWLGVYRVSQRASGNILTSNVLQALDDAAKDGMNVINMSFGSPGLTGASTDSVAIASDNLANAGIVVVNSAGNSGPDVMSIDETAGDPKIIAVGASQSDRVSANPAVLTPDGNPVSAGASTNATSAGPISGVLVDAATFDGGTGEFCNYSQTMPSLAGKIPLILRGDCNFTVKLRNAYTAGAQGAIVYNNAGGGDTLVGMDVSADPTIPALFVGYSDGIKLKNALAASEDDYQVVLRFVVQGNPDALTSFSSVGPAVELAIKPDLVADGSSVLTAGETTYSGGTLYSSSGYLYASGTSYSSPMVAGAAAVLMSARPWLWGGQYRSLLINNSRPLYDSSNQPLSAMQAGTGSLDLLSSYQASLVADPVSVSFGSVSANPSWVWKQIVVQNLSTDTRSYTVSLQTSDTFAPMITDSQITLAPGQVAGPILYIAGGTIPTGAHQGFVVFHDDTAGTDTRVPYWLAVASTVPAQISYIPPSSTTPGQTVTAYARVHDAAGLVMTNIPVTVRTVSGGAVVRSVAQASDYPGIWIIRIALDLTGNSSTFEVDAGSISRTFTITPGS
jgi:minor extracellular serine protease Vpr